MNGILQKAELPAEFTAALENAGSMQALPDALGTGEVQLLLTISGGNTDFGIEANAHQLRKAMAEKTVPGAE